MWSATLGRGGDAFCPKSGNSVECSDVGEALAGDGWEVIGRLHILECLGAELYKLNRTFWSIC